MSRRVLQRGFFLFLVALFLLPFSRVEGKEKEPSLIGSDAPDFSLPSSQDRLANYANDYHGKYHLIITFFPAAFTPI